MRTNQLLIFLLALLIIMPLVSSAKPFVTIPDSSGLQFAYSPYEVVKSNTNFTLHLHVINKTAIQTNTTTSCLLHLYNSVGLHILENKLEWDSNNVEFKLLITGGNFTVGQHAYIIQCNNTNKEISLINGVFMANKNGNVMTNSESITVFWNIMIIINDLIFYNSQLLHEKDYIVCSIDKDLKQIEGLHFDYYQLKKYDENGEIFKVRKGFKYMEKTDCENLLCELFLVGDTSDNIKGVKGIGEVKAKKIIYSKNSTYGKFRAICEAYKTESEFWKEKLRMNYKLLKFN